MHELSIAQALVEQLDEILKRQGGARVTSVRLRIGELSGVEPEALRLAFPVATEGTATEGARLDLEFVSSKVRCHACHKVSRPDFPFFVCEVCGSNDVEIISGRELTLVSVELEEEPSPPGQPNGRNKHV